MLASSSIYHEDTRVRDGKHVDHDDDVERHGSKLNGPIHLSSDFRNPILGTPSFWNLGLDLVPWVLYFSTIGTYYRGNTC